MPSLAFGLLPLFHQILNLFHRLEIGVPSCFRTSHLFDLTCPACHHSSVVNSVSLVRSVVSSCPLSDQESEPCIRISQLERHFRMYIKFFVVGK